MNVTEDNMESKASWDWRDFRLGPNGLVLRAWWVLSACIVAGIVFTPNGKQLKHDAVPTATSALHEAEAEACVSIINPKSVKPDCVETVRNTIRHKIQNALNNLNAPMIDN